MNPLPSYGESQPRGRRPCVKRVSMALPLLCLIIFGTVIGTSLLRSTSASAASLVPIKGEVPGLVKTSALVGATDTYQSLKLSVGLQLRNVNALKAYADNTIRSQSTYKPQHLTSAQISTAFAPLASSQQSVIDYMQGYGFHVTTTVKQHLIVGFNGTVGDAENAFHLTINNYRAPGGQSFYAPTNDPVVPANLARLIESVIGLDNVAQPARTASTGNGVIKVTSATATNNNVVCPSQGSGAPYLPSTIASAYNLNGFYNAGFQGEGQTVALIEDDTYYPSDITAYTQCFGGGSVPIHEIRTDGYPLGSPGPDAFTVEKDIELVLSAAPHLANLYIYELPYDNSDTNIINMWGQIISNNDISVISYSSYSLVQCEPQMAPQLLQQENTLFTLAAVQGQTIFASAGNTGNDACEIYDPSNPKQPSVMDPASQPYVTGVGGTTLTLANNATTYGSETVWNYGTLIKNETGNVPFGAGGGGISTIWPMPSWQQGPGVINTGSSGTPCSATSGYCREVPDVSLNADPKSGYLVYCGGGYCPNATSLNGAPYGNSGVWWIAAEVDSSTTLWAVFMTLTNEKTLHDGGFNIGFINPYLYQIAQNSTMYANDFHDVTTGSNDVLGNNFYSATPGYDMASGLGSYNAWNLGQDLEKLANAQNGSRQGPASLTWYFAQGAVGASFQEYIIVFNPSTQNATVKLTYLYPNGQPPTVKTEIVPPGPRFSIDVNAELGVPVNGPFETFSTIVSSDTPIVVDRPMYFNLNGISSGTDMPGATSATTTSFYFPQGDSTQSTTSHSTEYITAMNPSSTATARVTATFYSNGQVAGTDSVTIPPLQRGNLGPHFNGQAAIQVNSDSGIVVERSLYFNNDISSVGGWIPGATADVGATSLGSANGSDWLFADGYSGPGFQEYLVLANFTQRDTPTTIKLEYTNGSVQTVPVTVKAQSQLYFDVNNANAHPNCSPTSSSSCTVSDNVSAEVTAPTASIAAERLMYFHKTNDPGCTDVVGEQGPSSHAVYALPDVYTGPGFEQWLMLLNPNSHAEVVAITFFADNTIVQKEITLPATSRTSILLNSIVTPLANAYPNSAGYGASLEIQAFDSVVNGQTLKSTIVVESGMYFQGSKPGGFEMLGYAGG